MSETHVTLFLTLFCGAARAATGTATTGGGVTGAAGFVAAGKGFLGASKRFIPMFSPTSTKQAIKKGNPIWRLANLSEDELVLAGDDSIKTGGVLSCFCILCNINDDNSVFLQSLAQNMLNIFANLMISS